MRRIDAVLAAAVVALAFVVSRDWSGDRSKPAPADAGNTGSNPTNTDPADESARARVSPPSISAVNTGDTRVALEGTCSIEVTDGDHPIDGADVQALVWTLELEAEARRPLGLDRSRIEALLQTAQTDADGRATVRRPSFPLFVLATARGYQTSGTLVRAAPPSDQISIELKPATTLDVTVKELGGSVAPGVRVTAQPNVVGDWFRGIKDLDDHRIAGMLTRFESVTDEAGRCEFTSLPDGDQLVSIDPERCSREEAYAILPDQRSVELTLVPSGTIHGTVVDATTGRPVEGALATSFFATPERDEKWSSRSRTDSLGRYEIRTRANASAFGVRVFALGFATSIRRLAPLLAGEVRPLDIRLEAESDVHGVVSGPDGQPVPDVLVQAWTSDDGGWIGMDRTDSAGRYRIGGLDARRSVSIAADKSGYSSDSAAPVTAGRCDLRLGRVVHLRGRVSCDRIARFEGMARIYRDNGDGTRSLSHSVAVDPDSGAFDSQEIRPDTYHVDIIVRGASPLSVDGCVVEEDDEVHEFELEPGRQVDGRVIAAATDAGIAGAVLRLADMGPNGRLDGMLPGVLATTDAAGSFRLDALPASATAWVVAAADGFAPASFGIEPSPQSPVVVRLERSSALVVRPVDPRPLISGFTVEVFGGAVISQRRTSRFGEAVTFEDVPPGRCEIYIRVPQSDAYGRQSIHQEELVVAGETRTIEFSIGGAGKVEGRVVSHRPLEPSHRYYVAVVNVSDPTRGRHVDVAPDGSFEVRGLTAGAYEFSLHHESVDVSHVARRTIEVLESADQRVDLELRETGIRGVVRSQAGVALRAATVWYERAEHRPDAVNDGSTRTHSDGRYEVIGLDPGMHGIVVEANGFATARHYIDVADSGAPTEVDFALVPEAVIRARVRDTDGNPIENAELIVAHEKADDFPWFRSLFTGADGSCDVPALHAGKYRVTPMVDGFFPTREWVTTCAGRVSAADITMRRGVALEILVDDSDDRTVGILDVSTGETLDLWLTRRYCSTNTGTQAADALGVLAIDRVPADRLQVTHAGETIDIDLATAAESTMVSFREER